MKQILIRIHIFLFYLLAALTNRLILVHILFTLIANIQGCPFIHKKFYIPCVMGNVSCRPRISRIAYFLYYVRFAFPRYQKMTWRAFRIG